jgi:hypothetical protein
MSRADVFDFVFMLVTPQERNSVLQEHLSVRAVILFEKTNFSLVKYFKK